MDGRSTHAARPRRLDSLDVLMVSLDQLGAEIQETLSAPQSPWHSPPASPSFLQPPNRPLSNPGSPQGSPCKTSPFRQRQRRAFENEQEDPEGTEACQWLRAAGFPQYAQLYTESQFPVELSAVKADHDFLDDYSLRALCRRIEVLNKLCKSKPRVRSLYKDRTIEMNSHGEAEESSSSEDETCAISKRWTYQRSSRQWSRKDNATHLPPPDLVVMQRPITAGDLSSHTISTSPLKTKCNNQETERKPCGKSGDFKVDAVGQRLNQASRNNNLDAGKRRGLIWEMHDQNWPRNESLAENGDRKHSHGKQSRSGISTHEELLRNGNGNEGLAFGISNGMKNVFRFPSFAGFDSNLIDSRQKQSNGDYKRDSKSKFATVSGRSLAGSSTRPGLRLRLPSDYKAGTFPRALSFESITVVKPVKDSTPVKWTDGAAIQNQSQGNNTDEVRPASVYDNVPVTMRCSVENLVCTPEQEQWTHEPKTKRLSRSCPSSPDLGLPPIIDYNCNLSHSPQKSLSGLPTMHQSPDYSRKTLDEGPKELWQLDVCEIQHVQRLALLQLTAIMETHKAPTKHTWNWKVVARLARCVRNPELPARVVFGVSVERLARHDGCSLPPSLRHIIKQLSAHCDVEGLFRKSGSQLRIQTLREKVELAGPVGLPQLVAPQTHLEPQDPDAVDENFEDAMSSLHDQENKSCDDSGLCVRSNLLRNTPCPHSLADLLKCFLRELPLPLVPPKLFLSSARGTSLQLALLLLPDVAREALQSVLALLGAVAKSPHSRMTPHSLALCLAPSLCHLHRDLPARAPKHSGAIHFQMERQLVATECVTELISHHGKIFQVPQDLIAVESSYQYEVVPSGSAAVPFLQKLNYQLEQKLNALPHQVQSSGWKTVASPPGTQLAYKTVDDGCPLRLWRASLELNTSPLEALTRVKDGRRLWEPRLITEETTRDHGDCSEIYRYVIEDLPPRPPAEYLLCRAWCNDGRGCSLAETSVQHECRKHATKHDLKRPEVPQVQVQVLDSRYLFEEAGIGKCTVTHLCRVDTRGRAPQWYTTIFGLCTVEELLRIHNSFSTHS
uniref:rho GTPase-activating protein 7-like n=1 Tax=Myxine glutinosa TaxID=7769 RepID=UPI00358FEC0D